MARRMADVVCGPRRRRRTRSHRPAFAPPPEAQWPAVLTDPHVPAKVAWSPTLGYAPVDGEVLDVCERAVAVLESLGAEVVPVEQVFAVDPVRSWLTIVSACLLRSVEPHLGRGAGPPMHPGLAAMIEHGRGVTCRRADRGARRLPPAQPELVGLFHGARLLVTPTTAAPPPPLELAATGLINGQPDANWVRFTYPFNMTRSPAATVCAGLTGDGLPVGLQLVGPAHADLVVLRSAAALEEALGFDELAPFGR